MTHSSRASDSFRHDDRHADYDGTGVWLCCPDCNRPHRVEDGDFADRLEEACEDVGRTSAEIYASYGLNAGGGRWDVFPEAPLIIFTDALGRKIAGRYGVVGSWNETTHSWLWAWGFPEGWLSGPEGAAAHRIRAEGARQDWAALTTRTLLVNAHEAWHLTDLAADVMGWPMVYRVKVNDRNWHFLAIDRLSRQA